MSPISPVQNVVPSNGSTTVNFSNLSYPFSIYDGYYYLIVKYSNNYLSLNPYTNTLTTNSVCYSKFKIGNFNSGNYNDDFNMNLPTLLNLNSSYKVYLSSYLKGRETRFGSIPACFTSKSDVNTVDFFVKFKAVETSMTLQLEVPDISTESVIELMSSPKSCDNNFQTGTQLRNYTFNSLVVGNYYTARIEVGGDSQIGFTRLNATANASITLRNGVVTNVETEKELPFTLYPNPSSDGKLFIQSLEEIQHIKVTNILGQTEHFYNTNEFNTAFKGLIFIEVSSISGTGIKKIIVK